MVICGPSQSGKSSLARRIISENVYNCEIKRVLWCYDTWADWFAAETTINFHRGVPSENEEKEYDLIILDDLMFDVSNDVAKMFVSGSHHKNYSIILITQNLFPRVKGFRDISLNAHYFVLFRNNRDASQIYCFGRQAFPNQGDYFRRSYKLSTQKNFSYLLIDLHPTTPEIQRLRASIFPEFGAVNWVFLPTQRCKN